MVRTVPHDFIGPLRPGTIRLPPPKRFSGPVRPGIDVEEFRRTGRSIPIRRGGAGSSSASARAQAELKARQARVAAEQAAKVKAQREFIERAKLSRLQRERLDSLAKLARTKRVKQKVLKIKIEEVSRREGPIIRGVAIKKKTKETVGQKAVRMKRLRLADEKRARERRRVRREAPKEIMIGEVQLRPEEIGFVKRSIRKLEDLQGKRSTASIRKQQKDLKNELELLGLTIGTTIIGGVAALIALPSTAVSVAKDPSQLLKVPSAIARGGREFGQLIRVSPTEALGKIAGEVVLLKGTGETLRVVGKVGSKASARLSPKFKGVKEGKIVVKTSKGETTLRVGGTVKKISIPIKEQAKLAGKKVTAVSAQAEEIVKFTKSKTIVRKPIPGEATLSKTTKKLLKKFDDGKITVKQLNILDDAIRKETKGAGSLLERSFFADPQARFRPSRLGLQEPKRASLIDILSGDITFKANKPQILVFKDVKVQQFPASLRSVAKKLKAGKPLTKAETKKFIRFQQKVSGKFKPVGGLTREPEITLSPGEIIKRKKKIGVTLINGRKVSIVEAEVVKATKRTSQLLKKSKAGKITAKEIKELTKRLSKETGFKSSLSRGKIGKPRARVTTRIPRVRRPPRRVGRRPPRRPPKRPPRRPPKRPPRRPPKRPPKRPPRRPPKRPPKRPARVTRIVRVPKRPAKRGKTVRFGRVPKRPGKTTPTTTRKVSGIRRKKPLKKPVQVFDVFGKSRGRFVKLNVKPLTRGDALSRGAFAIDRTTSQTFKISPKGKSKTPGVLLKSERNYFNRQGFKLREVRIKKGRKFKLKQKWIEKRKFAIDTKSEKSGLTIAKLLKQQRKKRKGITPIKARKILRDKRIRGKSLTSKQKRFFRTRASNQKRRITPTQRNKMLANLRKARRVRMKNLKGGKKK